MKKMLFALTLSLMASKSFAAQFGVNCYYKNENLQACAKVVADIVTDKFTNKFPATQYRIFVYSNIHSYTNGGYSAFAVAGVVLKDSNDFPSYQFSTSKINQEGKYTSIQLAQYEYEVYRSAVQSLMERCEISPTCDVFKPNP
jgi:hypothetical protein